MPPKVSPQKNPDRSFTIHEWLIFMGSISRQIYNRPNGMGQAFFAITDKQPETPQAASIGVAAIF